jgi:ATP-dependent RNA helicase dbp5
VRENIPLHQVLILAHTRELILQINDVLTKLCTFTHIRTTCVLQGIHYDPTAQVVIGSVGAIKKAVMSGGFDYRALVCMVIDEADEMIRNRAFAADISALTKLFAGVRLPVQILLFSATFDDKVIQFAHRIAPGAVEIRKATTELQLSTVLLVGVEEGCEVVGGGDAII